MKAAILTQGGFEIRDVPIPQPGDNEVLVRTLASGVCTGDVFLYRNRNELAATPQPVGHEGTGEVLAAGRLVPNLQPGDVVTTLAIPTHAEYYTAEADRVVRLPQGIDPVYALGEPVACCVHAAGRFGIQTGDRVAILGLGFMGMLCLQLARLQGAGFIIGVEPLAERRAMGLQMGADQVIGPEDRSPSLDGTFDVVIEAAGVQAVVDAATGLVRQHGRIILVGYHQSRGGMRTVNMQTWNFKAIDVVNGHVRRSDEKLEAMREGMRLVQQGRLSTQPLVTIYPLSEAEQAFRDLVARKPGLYKAVLIP